MALIDIDRRSVSALSKKPSDGSVYYDRRLTGFGLRVSSAGRVSYFVEWRPGSGGRRVSKRRIVIGRDEPPMFRADHARAAAEQYLAKVRLGGDPATDRANSRCAPTVTEVLNGYLENRIARLRKASTHALYSGYSRIHIQPHIGKRPANLLTRAEVTSLHAKIGRNHRVTANRVIVLLRAALDYAAREGLIQGNFANPAVGVDAYRENLREKYLSSEEFRRLGETLELASTEGLMWHPDSSKNLKHAPAPESRRIMIDPFAIAAIRLLVLTGARLREILNLKWEQIDFEHGTALLPESKTGRRVLVLGEAALSVLRAIPRTGGFVIAGMQVRGPDGQLVDAPRSDLNRPWKRIRTHAQLGSLRLHDLRHSFASVGASAGLGLYVVGQLLGHRSPSTTSRYAHIANAPLTQASNAISQSIAAALGIRS